MNPEGPPDILQAICPAVCFSTPQLKPFIHNNMSDARHTRLARLSTAETVASPRLCGWAATYYRRVGSQIGFRSPRTAFDQARRPAANDMTT